MGGIPDGLLEVIVGGNERAEQLADDPRVPLVSATGSTRDGPRARRPASPRGSAAACSSWAATTR